MTEEDRQVIADLLNEIFHLPINWTSFDSEEIVDKQLLARLQNLLQALSPKLTDPRFLSAIGIASEINKTIRDRYVDEVLNNDAATELRQALKDKPIGFDPEAGADVEIIQAIQRIVSQEPGPTVLFFGMKSVDAHFERFMAQERHILLSSGLDQAAVGAILERLRMKRAAIARNISVQHAVYPSRYLRSLKSLDNALHGVLHMKSSYRGIKTKRMGRIKDKVVGVATIWGDLVPLFFVKDLGVASFWSTIAGATALSVIPS